MTQKITPSLWFDDNLDEAIAFYIDLFPDSELISKSYWPEGGMAPAGTLLSARFRIFGTEFIGINGGPTFTFSEAVSFEIEANTQEEIDFYWNRLTDGGEESQCGWCKDRFGLSWQVVPKILEGLLVDPDPGRASRAMKAMLAMQKLDIAALIAASDGDN